MDDTQKPNSQTPNPTVIVQPGQSVLGNDAANPNGTTDLPEAVTALPNPSSTPGDTVSTQSVSTPVGGKEGYPVPTVKQEWVAPSIPEITPAAEVSPFMEVKSEIPKIPQAVAQAGVKLAKEATPVKTATVGELDKNLNLQTANAVLTALKKAHGNVKDSVRWLVELVGLAKMKEELLAKEKPEGGAF